MTFRLCTRHAPDDREMEFVQAKAYVECRCVSVAARLCFGLSLYRFCGIVSVSVCVSVSAPVQIAAFAGLSLSLYSLSIPLLLVSPSLFYLSFYSLSLYSLSPSLPSSLSFCLIIYLSLLSALSLARAISLLLFMYTCRNAIMCVCYLFMLIPMFL